MKKICTDKTYRYEFGKNTLMNYELKSISKDGSRCLKKWYEVSRTRYGTSRHRYQTVLARRLKLLVLFVCVEVLRPSQKLRSCRAGQLPINSVPGQA